MSDCVDREAVVGILKKLGLGKDIDYADEMYLAALSDVARHIKSLSSVEPERAKGYWEFKKIGVSTFAIVCSECGNVLHKGQNYNNLESFKQHIQSLLDDKEISIDKFCHECGADMREEDVE